MGKNIAGKQNLSSLIIEGHCNPGSEGTLPSKINVIYKKLKQFSFGSLKTNTCKFDNILSSW